MVEWGYSEEGEAEEEEEEVVWWRRRRRKRREEEGKCLKRRTELDKEKMYCGGERRWRKEISKEKCMMGVEEEE